MIIRREVAFSLRDLLRTDILISATTSYKQLGRRGVAWSPFWPSCCKAHCQDHSCIDPPGSIDPPLEIASGWLCYTAGRFSWLRYLSGCFGWLPYPVGWLRYLSGRFGWLRYPAHLFGWLRYSAGRFWLAPLPFGPLLLAPLPYWPF